MAMALARLEMPAIVGMLTMEGTLDTLGDDPLDLLMHFSM